MSRTESSAALTACDREPIHIPGAIQPHGVLIALDPSDLTVVQIAGDTTAFFRQEPASLFGQSLSIQLGGANLERLALLAQTRLAPRPTLLFQVEGSTGMLDVSAHSSGGQIVLEFERRRQQGPEPLERVQKMTAAVQSSRGVRETLDSIAREVQESTGFDRVMVYRFAADDSGHVVAEARRSAEIESFLDLHYPASDIPQQARRLYSSNWIRSIPDVHYQPALLEPADNPRTAQPLDLSFSALRSVSPIHLQYLANMGVGASLSLSLIVQGRLWGLIACHHSRTHYLDSRVRSALELFAQVCSLQLATQLELEDARLAAARRDSQDVLFAALAQQGFPAALIQQATQLRRLVDAAGVAIHVNGKTATEGQVPDNTAIAKVIDWLNDQAQQGVWASDRLGELCSAARDMHTAAGLLAISISREPRDYVLWFLPAMRTTVTWAGDPEKAAVEIHDRPSPRKSFAAWVETVTGRSRPWLSGEIESAARLRVALLEFVIRHVDELARERDALVKRQDLLMAELDHRVKNILTTIQALVRFSGKSAESLAEFTRALERRLLSMSRAHDLLMSSRWESASLHRLIAEELGPFCPPDSARFRLVGEDISLLPAAALSLSLLLHELTTNAAKYGALSTPNGTVTIANETVRISGKPARVIVRWTESNGPEVTPPTRRGFGRVLLERVFEGGAHDNHVDLQFAPEGVRCTIDMNAERVLSNGPRPRAAEPAAVEVARPELLAGRKILVAEDDGLIALFIDDLLSSAGATIIGPFGSLAAAMDAAGQNDIDAALLDIDLGGRGIWPVAHVLRDRGIPIVFATGFSGTDLRPEAFRHAATIRKPLQSEQLVSALSAATSRAR